MDTISVVSLSLVIKLMPVERFFDTNDIIKNE